MRGIIYFSAALILFLALIVEIYKRYLEHPIIEDIDKLETNLTAWLAQGKFYTINGHKMFVIVKGLDNNNEKSPIIFMHGHPSSSFQYHSAVKNLLEETNHPVILFDHVGYGFSDKPGQGFSYSVFDHADNVLKLWTQLGIRNAHIVSHDYSNLVIQEIFARRNQNMISQYFDNFFTSVTMSNGGIQNPSQTNFLDLSFTDIIFKIKCLLSIFINVDLNLWKAHTWGSGDRSEKWQNIHLLDSLHQFKSSQRQPFLWKLFFRESLDYQSRWTTALSKLDVPCHIIWGDTDPSSPIDIVKDLSKNVIPHQFIQGATVQGAGHFPMIEQPTIWAKLVARFFKKIDQQQKKVTT